MSNNIVIDASAIIAVITNEPSKAALIRLTQNANLIAPSSIHWEIGNAFSAMLKRKRLPLNDVVTAIQQYETIPIRFVDVEIERAVHLAATLNIYAYDAYLIRCALKYKAPLLSLDQGLIQSAKFVKAQTVEVNL